MLHFVNPFITRPHELISRLIDIILFTREEDEQIALSSARQKRMTKLFSVCTWLSSADNTLFFFEIWQKVNIFIFHVSDFKIEPCNIQSFINGMGKPSKKIIWST